MTDALNQRIHHDTIAADAPTVTGARGHRISVGDLIITRQNDASISLRRTDDPEAERSPVRNGQRWQVTQIKPDNERLSAAFALFGATGSADLQLLRHMRAR